MYYVHNTSYIIHPWNITQVECWIDQSASRTVTMHFIISIMPFHLCYYNNNTLPLNKTVFQQDAIKLTYTEKQIKFVCVCAVCVCAHQCAKQVHSLQNEFLVADSRDAQILELLMGDSQQLFTAHLFLLKVLNVLQ